MGRVKGEGGWSDMGLRAKSGREKENERTLRTISGYMSERSDKN